MKNLKSYQWQLLGVVSIIAGSAIFYFFRYNNIQPIEFLCIMLILCGWLMIVYSVFPDFFNRSKKSTRIILLKAVALIFLCCMIGFNITYVTKLEKDREKDILTHEATKITIAKVIWVEMRQLKQGSRCYIHLQYVVNGDTILQEMPDDKGKFFYQAKYRLRYAVGHPRMFEMVDSIPVQMNTY